MPFDRGYDPQQNRYKRWTNDPTDNTDTAGPWAQDGMIDQESSMSEEVSGRFIKPRHIGMAQDEFANNEVGIVHPNRNSFIRIRDNGDIEMVATDGCSMILSATQRTLFVNADEVRFITNTGGLLWNKMKFNDNALSFKDPTLIPNDFNKANNFLLASPKIVAPYTPKPATQQEQIVGMGTDWSAPPANQEAATHGPTMIPAQPEPPLVRSVEPNTDNLVVIQSAPIGLQARLSAESPVTGTVGALSALSMQTDILTPIIQTTPTAQNINVLAEIIQPSISTVSTTPACVTESFDKADGSGIAYDQLWGIIYGAETLGGEVCTSIDFAAGILANPVGFADMIVSMDITAFDLNLLSGEPYNYVDFSLFARSDSSVENWFRGTFSVGHDTNQYYSQVSIDVYSGSENYGIGFAYAPINVGDNIALRVTGTGDQTSVDLLINDIVVVSADSYEQYGYPYYGASGIGSLLAPEPVPSDTYAGFTIEVRRRSYQAVARANRIDNFAVCPA